SWPTRFGCFWHPPPMSCSKHLRRAVLKGTQLAQARVGTLRVKLLKVAARVTVSVRRVVLHLSSYYPYRQLFTRVAARLVPI
ncbi:MAG TPA: transposase, partial [Phycisphaerae bacterium]|nr:transposase [Phycisphaerae bacterium]